MELLPRLSQGHFHYVVRFSVLAFPTKHLYYLQGDSDPNLSHFYEVLFLGKIKASHKRAPPTFIDDALQKFEVRENNKAKKRLDKTKEEEHEPVDGGGRNKENYEMVVNTPVPYYPA